MVDETGHQNSVADVHASFHACKQENKQVHERKPRKEILKAEPKAFSLYMKTSVGALQGPLILSEVVM